MTIGDFRVGGPNEIKGWLKLSKESDSLQIISPKDGQTFFTEPGASKKNITVKGVLKTSHKGKVLLVVRTDRDYPKALVKLKADGSWSLTNCDLGGVDHQIYALLIDENDKPILRSKVVTVRLERKI